MLPNWMRRKCPDCGGNIQTNYREALEAIRDYPKEGHDRRDEEGYPREFVYDEFAYKRMVDSFRDAALAGLAHGRRL